MIWLEKIKLLGCRFCGAEWLEDVNVEGIGDLAKVMHEGWKGQVADTPRGARFRINGFPHTHQWQLQEHQHQQVHVLPSSPQGTSRCYI